MSAPIRVGVVGAGLVLQAVHGRLVGPWQSRFAVCGVMDPDHVVGGRAARLLGAPHLASLSNLLDLQPQALVLCSPHVLHATQVAQAAAAGVKAVLCEKPLVTNLADLGLVQDATSTGLHLVAGAMHAHDPAFVQALGAWRDGGRRSRLVRSVAYLPPNEELIAMVTDPHAAPVARTVGSLLDSAVLGLASHVLPTVRALLPGADDVTRARFVPPFGYHLQLRSPDGIADLLAVVGGRWEASWRLTAEAADGHLDVSFPPSYVQSGSSVATVTTAQGDHRWQHPNNGYQREWDLLERAVHGDPAAAATTAQATADAAYLLTVLDSIRSLQPIDAAGGGR